MGKPAAPFACCFTGHRPDHLPWGWSCTGPNYTGYCLRLTQAIEEAIAMGCRVFYCGMAQGIDLMAGEAVLALREANPKRGIKLVAVCPHAGQAGRWEKTDQEKHRRLLEAADGVVILESAYTPYCFHQRNRYMVDQSDVVIAGYDGVSPGGTAWTVAYARKKGKTVLSVPPV